MEGDQLWNSGPKQHPAVKWDRELQEREEQEALEKLKKKSKKDVEEEDESDNLANFISSSKTGGQGMMSDMGKGKIKQMPKELKNVGNEEKGKGKKIENEKPSKGKDKDLKETKEIKGKGKDKEEKDVGKTGGKGKEKDTKGKAKDGEKDKGKDKGKGKKEKEDNKKGKKKEVRSESSEEEEGEDEEPEEIQENANDEEESEEESEGMVEKKGGKGKKDKKKKGGEEKAEEKKEEKVLSKEEVKEMDEKLMEAFLNACKVSITEKDLPLEPGKLWASHMLKCRADEASEIDFKDSSYKKIGKFLQVLAKDKLITYEEASKKNPAPKITKIDFSCSKIEDWQETVSHKEFEERLRREEEGKEGEKENWKVEIKIVRMFKPAESVKQFLEKYSSFKQSSSFDHFSGGREEIQQLLEDQQPARERIHHYERSLEGHM
jgi:hypothetical protein